MQAGAWYPGTQLECKLSSTLRNPVHTTSSSLGLCVSGGVAGVVRAHLRHTQLVWRRLLCSRPLPRLTRAAAVRSLRGTACGVCRTANTIVM